MRRVVWLALGGLLVGLTVACGGAMPAGGRAIYVPVPTVPVDARAPTDGAQDAALEMWRGFPAGRMPRPIVLQSPTAGGGFTNGDAKEAAQAGHIELVTEPPAGPAAVSVQLPDGPVTYPAISARAAFDALIADAGIVSSSTRALRITGVDLGAETFHTDRGELELPVWRFNGPGIAGVIAWPALTPAAVWPWRRIELPVERRVQLPMQRATISEDGRLLTVTLWQPKPVCDGQPTYRHDPVVTQDAAVVVVGMTRVVVQEPTAPPGTPCSMDLAWGGDEHIIRLAAPLGGRAVVGEDGAPLTVTCAESPLAPDAGSRKACVHG
jgi:hypothetical protein